MTTRSGQISVSLFLILLLLQFASPPSAGAAAFSDIQGHWAEGSINQLIASQAISGYPDNTFRPENTITRAEFASILMKAFNFAPKANVVVFLTPINTGPKTPYPMPPLMALSAAMTP